MAKKIVHTFLVRENKDEKKIAKEVLELLKKNYGETSMNRAYLMAMSSLHYNLGLK